MSSGLPYALVEQVLQRIGQAMANVVEDKRDGHGSLPVSLNFLDRPVACQV